MIYIVSGHPRTGTSMMMEALIKGGLTAAYSQERNNQAAKWGDDYYKPNPNGLYEIDFDEYCQPDFPLKYQDKLIKVFFQGLSNLAPSAYKIIFMLRDIKEIAQSYEAMFSTVSAGRARLRPDVISGYREVMEQSIQSLEKRPDVSLTILDFSEVVSNPIENFKLLALLGWPINPVEAASVVKPSLYRFRKELLI